jgi:hypothetical protein
MPPLDLPQLIAEIHKPNAAQNGKIDEPKNEIFNKKLDSSQ